jgi:hyperosmotically inducible protein
MSSKGSLNVVFLFIFGVTLPLGGCFKVVTETAKKAMEDRTTEDQVTDTKIATSILSEFSNKDKGLLLDVNVDVWEQRVLLTGTLDDQKVRNEVVQLVKSDNRIKTVYDEIQIVTDRKSVV